MTMTRSLQEAVRRAWSTVPAPPAEDLQLMEWGWGEKAANAFVGVAPVDVDIQSGGFAAATPLLDLPPRAAAAYLGPYLLSLLDGLEFQKRVGLFDDVLSRAHTLTCLTSPDFWAEVIRPFLPAECRDVLVEVVAYLTSERGMLALTDEQIETMLVEAGLGRGSE